MNDNYDLENGLFNSSFKKTSGRYYNNTQTFVDIPLTPTKENNWRNKLTKIRDALVEGTLQSSLYTPVSTTKNIKLSNKNSSCDKCTIC